MYKLTDVRKDYPKGRSVVHALAGVDAVIEDGEWLAIQGPTGHGKSTLLQVLGGLDRPTSGVVEFDGQNLSELRFGPNPRARQPNRGQALSDRPRGPAFGLPARPKAANATQASTFSGTRTLDSSFSLSPFS